MVVAERSTRPTKHPILAVLKREGRWVSWLRQQLEERPDGRRYHLSHLSLVLNGHRPATPELRRLCVEILGSRYPESDLFHPVTSV
jgi:hypothetical protein